MDKVLHVINAFSIGGAEILVSHICKSGRRYDHEVVALRNFGTKEELEVRQRLFESEGIVTHTANKPPGLSFFRPLSELKNVIANVGPSIIHSHCELPDLFASFTSRTFGKRITYVRTIHNAVQWPNRPIVGTAIERLITGTFHGTIACVPLENGRRVPRQFKTIYNGILIDENNVPPVGLAEDNPPIIGVVGRLTKQKGHEVLVKAFPAVLERCPEATMIFIGDGPQRTKLEDMATRLGIAERIKFIGAQAEPHRWMKSFSAAVLPSIWEGLPLTLLEYLWHGVPVVASNLPVIAQIMDEVGYSYLTEPGNVEGLSKAIIACLHDRPRLLPQLLNGQDVVKSSYSVARVVEDYEAYYDSFIKYRRNSVTLRHS